MRLRMPVLALATVAATAACETSHAPEGATIAARPTASIAAISPPASAAGDTTTRDVDVSGVRVLEIFTHGATESSPLVIALHGRGGSPENLARVFADYPGTLQIALPQAPIPIGSGSEWFDAPIEGADDRLTHALDAAEQQLWPVLGTIAGGRRMIVTGFSQGGFMTYVLASRHPDAIVSAFPVSGAAPRGLFPHDHAKSAPLYALHGTDDPVVPIQDDRATIAAFKTEGAIADLHEFPNTRHEMPPPLRADLLAHVRAAAESVR